MCIFNIYYIYVCIYIMYRHNYIEVMKSRNLSLSVKVTLKLII